MTILALGDSFTFGAELPDLPAPVAGFFGNDYFDQTTNQPTVMAPSKLSWASLLAQRLGEDLDNHSVIGGSNSRIFRRAVVDTATKPYSLVICAWTQFGRIDISYQNRECPAAANNIKWPWMKNYFADHYDLIQDQQRFLAEILSLQSYFKLRNQPYVFIKSMPLRLDPSLHTLHDQLDLSHCVAWDSCMCNLTQHLPFGPHGHFLEQGHQLVADVVYDFIQSKIIAE